MTAPADTNRLKCEKPNREGLTLVEWLCAANPDRGAKFYYETQAFSPTLKNLREHYGSYVAAWLAGEDPTEWRAAHA